jgi:hypothetical protein
MASLTGLSWMQTSHFRRIKLQPLVLKYIIMSLGVFCVNGICLLHSVMVQISAHFLFCLMWLLIHTITTGRGNTSDSECVCSDRGCTISIRSRKGLNYKHMITERSVKVSRSRVGLEATPTYRSAK